MNMDPNIVAWMAGGGPRLEDSAARHNRRHLAALRESTRSGPGLAARLAAALRSARAPEQAAACCPA